MNIQEGETYRNRLLLDFLRAPESIRSSCNNLLQYAQSNKLKYFKCDLDKISVVSDYVNRIILRLYPTLNIPYHSRWRHFEAGNIDRLELLRTQTSQLAPEDRLKSAIELVIVSVLLDAGAGPLWRYKDHKSNTDFTSSEGLAVASFNLFMQGVFSSDRNNPCQVDAIGLQNLQEFNLANGFQVSSSNPLIGVSGRLKLLQELGECIASKPEFFGADNPRLGNILEHWLDHVVDHTLSMKIIFASLLEAFNDIWPGRHYIDNINLGDVWPYELNITQLNPQGYTPFHKLTQWLCYSLIEPLESLDIEISDLDVLTGLPEYRNGGLFVDLQVLTPLDKRAFEIEHTLSSEFIVEWRALTVMLLDQLADQIRTKLSLSSDDLPLAKILQGGSWIAGRMIAIELRKDGRPPFKLSSDGTIF